MRGLTAALLAALAAAQTSPSPLGSPSAPPSPRPIQVVSLGTLPTQTAITLSRQGTIAPAGAVGGVSELFYSFTMPATPQSFGVYLSTGSTAVLQGALNTAGVVSGSFTPRYTLAGSGVGSTRSIVLYSNDATVGITAGQVWYVRITSQSTSTLSFNLTVQNVAAPSPAPSPGYTFPLTFGENGRQEVVGLPLNSYVYYQFSVPTSGIPGFRVELQPSATTDADLFFSRAAPQGSVFNDELNSQAGSGALDSVTVMPGDATWLPAGGPYYIKVKAFSACSYTIRVVAIAPSPSPPPYVPTAQPSAGTVPHLPPNSPYQAVVNPTVPQQARQCYRYRSSASSGEFQVLLRLIDNLPMNIAVHWAWPATANNIVIRVTSSPGPLPSPAPGVPASVTARVLRNNAQWIGYAGEYFVCAEAGSGVSGPATFRISVTDLDPSTISPSPRALRSEVLQPGVVAQGATLEWGAYRFYTFDAAIAGAVSFRLIPTRQATGTTGGTIQDFQDNQPVDMSDWWVVKRSAVVVDGHLTLSNGRGQRGYAWLAERKAVWPNFAITFDFNILTAGAFDNGEGFCFTMHNDPRGTNAEGNIGDGLGLGQGGAVDGPTRITRSVSVCLDTFPGTTGNPYPNRADSKMFSFVSVDGNLTCNRDNADRSGCAFNLPDLSLGSSSYSFSVRSERIGTTNDAKLHWSMNDAYTGTYLGSWQTVVPGFATILNLASFSNMAMVGFTAGTSTNYYSTHTILNYYWGAREQLLTGLSGGDSDLYVSVSPPTNPDSFSMADTQSTNEGLDLVRIDPTDSFYRGAGGRYYVAVYCAGPSGCTYTLEGQVGNPFPSMTPTPAFGIPSASKTAAPSVAPNNRLLLVNTTVSRFAQLGPHRASYYSLTRKPGYFGPITVYLEHPLPNPSAGPTPSRNPDYAAYPLRLELAVSQTIPTCTNGIYGNVPMSGTGSCPISRDVLSASGAYWITLTADMPAYPLGSEPVYIEVRNPAPLDMGASGNVTYRLRIAHDAGPSGGGADSGATGIIIAVVVAVIVIAGVVMGGLIVMKRMKLQHAAVVAAAAAKESSSDSGSSGGATAPSTPLSAYASGGSALSSQAPVPMSAYASGGGFAAASPISSAASHISTRGLPGMTVSSNPYNVASAGTPAPPPPVRNGYPATGSSLF